MKEWGNIHPSIPSETIYPRVILGIWDSAQERHIPCPHGAHILEGGEDSEHRESDTWPRRRNGQGGAECAHRSVSQQIDRRPGKGPLRRGALEDEGAWSHVGVGRRDFHTAESQPGMCELQEDSSGAECEEGQRGDRPGA